MRISDTRNHRTEMMAERSTLEDETSQIRWIKLRGIKQEDMQLTQSVCSLGWEKQLCLGPARRKMRKKNAHLPPILDVELLATFLSSSG